MLLVINIIVLTLGTIGALTAFGGETWRKSDDPLLKRITFRGWVALPCLFAALALGITKEVVSYRRTIAAAEAASAAAAESSRVQADLQDKLKETRKLLKEAEERLSLVPKAIDHPFYQTGGANDGIVRSSEGQGPLFTYGGEVIEYQIHGEAEEHPDRIVFEIGKQKYPLKSASGSINVIGTSGEAMPVRLVYPKGLTFAIKMTLMSAVRPMKSASETISRNGSELKK